MKTRKDIYQGMEGGDGEYTQSTHCQLCGSTGKSKEPFGVGELPSLQAGKVAPKAE